MTGDAESLKHVVNVLHVPSARKMRREAIKAPFWARPFVLGTVEKTLRKQVFIPSDTECSCYNRGTDVDATK